MFPTKARLSIRNVRLFICNIYVRKTETMSVILK